MSTYEVTLAPGCYSGVSAPTVSAHKTLAAALDKARKSDRLCVSHDGRTYIIPAQGHKRLGAGRYGGGLARAEARALGWPL